MHLRVLTHENTVLLFLTFSSLKAGISEVLLMFLLWVITSHLCRYCLMNMYPGQTRKVPNTNRTFRNQVYFHDLHETMGGKKCGEMHTDWEVQKRPRTSKALCSKPAPTGPPRAVGLARDFILANQGALNGVSI